MASVVIAGDTSGSITLAAPAVAGTNTLTLPTLTGTVLTNKTAGTVLQVVQTTYSTNVTTSSSTFSDTGLSASITPTSSTSKILVMVCLSTPEKNTNNAYIRTKLVRGSTDICYMTDIAQYTGNTVNNLSSYLSVNYLDSPATTSSTTYKVQYASGNNNAAVAFNGTFGTAVVSTMTLMEIAA